MSTNAYKIAVIPGDGIGNEVVPPTCRILEAVARKHDLGFTFDEKDWSCERFHKKGAMMPEEESCRYRWPRQYSIGCRLVIQGLQITFPYGGC